MPKPLKSKEVAERASLGIDLLPPPRARRRRKEDPASIGASLAAVRVEAGMTQSELAAGAGVGISSVRKIEQGDLGVNLRTLLKLVHFLDHDLNVAPRHSKSGTPATKAASR